MFERGKSQSRPSWNWLVVVCAIVSLVPGCRQKEKIDTAICGIIASERGHGIESAYVVLDGTTYQTTTNAKGKFTLCGFPEGTYTVTAYKPGYIAAARYNVEINRQRRRVETMLVLKEDPNFIPDSVKITDISPTPESVLTPGREIAIRFKVAYTLSSDSYGTIGVSYQDDKGNALMPMPSRVTLASRKGTVTFGQNIRVPQRMDGKILVIAAMFPGAARSSTAADMVTYYVRLFSDQIKISLLEDVSTDLWEKGREVTLIAKVEYVLKSIERGHVRAQVRGDLGNRRFEVILQEESYRVDKLTAESGSFQFRPSFAIPRNVMAIRVRADLVPDNMQEPLIIQWSEIRERPRQSADSPNPKTK